MYSWKKWENPTETWNKHLWPFGNIFPILYENNIYNQFHYYSWLESSTLVLRMKSTCIHTPYLIGIPRNLGLNEDVINFISIYGETWYKLIKHKFCIYVRNKARRDNYMFV